MKKLLLIISFSLLSFISYSQSTTYYAYLVKTGDFNQYSEKWVYDEGTKCNMKIDVLDNYIRIHDKAQSNYTTYGGENFRGDGYDGIKYDGIDEQQRRVEVSIINYYRDKSLVIMVRYKSVIFAYYVTRANGYNQ